MVRTHVLPNGMRIVTERVPGVRSVSVGCWVDVGSRDEAPEQNGICHFVEHMMFKGTRRRSARDIAEVMDATGGQLNAFTTKEATCYYARVLDEHLPVALDLLADMVLDSVFRTEDVAREREVILEEIRLSEDTPEDNVHDVFEQALFGSHPLARPVLGTAKTVGACTRGALVKFVQEHYSPSRLVVAASGNVDHDRLVDAVVQLFGERRGPAPHRTAVALNYRAGWVMVPRSFEQVHLCVGVPALNRRDPDRFALQLLDTVLGGGMSSRLFQELREERGLVYSTYSYHFTYGETGVLAVYAGTSADKAPEVLDVIRAELEEAYRGEITAEEVERAKEQVKGSLMLSLESTAARMSRLGREALAGEPHLSPRQLVRRIDAVTLEDVIRVAERLLRPELLTVVGLGAVPSSWRAQVLEEAAI
ncbi:MAG: insulinase family protein [Firmicutes bacterium]|nr:insulinase family protein [Bacillota bacterium]